MTNTFKKELDKREAGGTSEILDRLERILSDEMNSFSPGEDTTKMAAVSVGSRLVALDHNQISIGFNTQAEDQHKVFRQVILVSLRDNSYKITIEDGVFTLAGTFEGDSSQVEELVESVTQAYIEGEGLVLHMAPSPSKLVMQAQSIMNDQELVELITILGLGAISGTHISNSVYLSNVTAVCAETGSSEPTFILAGKIESTEYCIGDGSDIEELGFPEEMTEELAELAYMVTISAMLGGAPVELEYAEAIHDNYMNRDNSYISLIGAEEIFSEDD